MLDSCAIRTLVTVVGMDWNPVTEPFQNPQFDRVLQAYLQGLLDYGHKELEAVQGPQLGQGSVCLLVDTLVGMTLVCPLVY